MTPYANVTPCASSPSTFQTNYDFTNGIQCWTAKVDTGTNYITGFGTTSLVQYTGQSVLAVSVSNPTGSPVTVSIDFIEATSAAEVLTGGSVTAYARIDSNLTVAGPQAQIYSIGGAPGYGYDDSNNNWPSVTSSGWAQIIENGVGNANSQQLGVQVYNVAVPANSSGNIYLADVSLNIPPASTPTMTPSPTVTSTPGGPTATATSTTVSSGCTLLYDCQALVENNYSWAAGANAAISTSSTWHTYGTQSIDCNVTTGNTWCKIANINSFFPISTTGMTQIIADVDVDASMVTGNGGYDQLVLQTNAGNTLATAAIGLAAGAQSVTFTVSGSVAASINDYEFIYQSGGTPTGNIYLDNIQVVFTGACPTPVPDTYIQGWNFEGNSLTDTVGTWVTIGGADLGMNLLVTQPGDLSSYCADVTANFTAANQTAGMIMVPGTAIDGSSFTGIRASFWIDSSCAPGQYPSGEIQLGDGTNYPSSPWTNLTLGGWTTITYPVSSWGTFTTSNINMVKVFVNLGGASAFGSGHVKFDNIEFY